MCGQEDVVIDRSRVQGSWVSKGLRVRARGFEKLLESRPNTAQMQYEALVARAVDHARNLPQDFASLCEQWSIGSQDKQRISGYL